MKKWAQDIINDSHTRVTLNEKLNKYINKGMVDFIPVYNDGRELIEDIDGSIEELTELVVSYCCDCINGVCFCGYLINCRAVDNHSSNEPYYNWTET